MWEQTQRFILTSSIPIRGLREEDHEAPTLRLAPRKKPVRPAHRGAAEVADPPARPAPTDAIDGSGSLALGRPSTEAAPELEVVANPDHAPDKPSPFDVILDVVVPDPGVPIVLAHVDIVQLQATLPESGPRA
jgi:hypothetical protein